MLISFEKKPDKTFKIAYRTKYRKTSFHGR